MNNPDCIQMAEGYARYRPKGEVLFQEAVDLVSGAIAFAYTNHIRKLLVDITQLTGFESPGIWERFLMAIQCAQAAHLSVVVAVVAKAEHIDPDRFGVMVARNHGLICNVFAAEDDALAWLFAPHV